MIVKLYWIWMHTSRPNMELIFSILGGLMYAKVIWVLITAELVVQLLSAWECLVHGTVAGPVMRWTDNFWQIYNKVGV